MRRAGLLLMPAALLLAGCSGAVDTEASSAVPDSVSDELVAERVVHVSDVHDATGMTLLEGPVLGPDGHLYVVDVTAPPGAGKVLSIDLEDGAVETVYTDDSSALTSAQINSGDGRLYVTDFLGGAILSMTLNGTDVREEFSGPVDGTPMQPDDIAFGDDGALYVTDASGAQSPYWEPTGRVVRVDPGTGVATVLADELPSPNGIGFTPTYDALWIGLNTGNRIDRLTLTEDRMQVATAFPAIHASTGVGQVDSIAVDSAGNLYVGLHSRPEILVYDTGGHLTTTVRVPAAEADELSSATNVAITPDSTAAYMTVSGSSGGYVYAFDALANGIPQSNGG